MARAERLRIRRGLRQGRRYLVLGVLALIFAGAALSTSLWPDRTAPRVPTLIGGPTIKIADQACPEQDAALNQAIKDLHKTAPGRTCRTVPSRR